MIGVRLRSFSPGPLRDNGWVVIEFRTENFSVEKEQAEAGCCKGGYTGPYPRGGHPRRRRGIAATQPSGDGHVLFVAVLWRTHHAGG